MIVLLIESFIHQEWQIVLYVKYFTEVHRDRFILVSSLKELYTDNDDDDRLIQTTTAYTEDLLWARH